MCMFILIFDYAVCIHKIRICIGPPRSSYRCLVLQIRYPHPSDSIKNCGRLASGLLSTPGRPHRGSSHPPPSHPPTPPPHSRFFMICPFGGVRGDAPWLGANKGSCRPQTPDVMISADQDVSAIAERGPRTPPGPRTHPPGPQNRPPHPTAPPLCMSRVNQPGAARDPHPVGPRPVPSGWHGFWLWATILILRPVFEVTVVRTIFVTPCEPPRSPTHPPLYTRPCIICMCFLRSWIYLSIYLWSVAPSTFVSSPRQIRILFDISYGIIGTAARTAIARLDRCSFALDVCVQYVCTIYYMCSWACRSVVCCLRNILFYFLILIFSFRKIWNFDLDFNFIFFLFMILLRLTPRI